MFTGLVEEKGSVESIAVSGETARLAIHASKVRTDVAIGDSISVNGCCLTVVLIDDDRLEFDAGDETMRRTTLGLLSDGSTVNLERAMRASDRMGGHYVTGHVDTVIRIIERDDKGEWSTIWFELPKEWHSQLVSKGSVAIDGISLTVCDVLDDRFSVMLVPHTLAATTLGEKLAGDSVNLETDLLAKYIARQLAAFTSSK